MHRTDLYCMFSLIKCSIAVKNYMQAGGKAQGMMLIRRGGSEIPMNRREGEFRAHLPLTPSKSGNHSVFRSRRWGFLIEIGIELCNCGVNDYIVYP